MGNFVREAHRPSLQAIWHMSFLEAAFLCICVGAILLLIKASKNKQVVLVYSSFAACIGIAASLHFFQNTEVTPPRFLFVLAPGVLITAYFSWKLEVPERVELLLLIHALRLPIELVLHSLFCQGLVPELMTYQGWNFDILSGISALILWFLHCFGVPLGRRLLLVWNVLALLLVVVIVVLAILSAPLPLQQLAFEQPNIAVLQFPYTLLPGLLVPLVFLAHFLMIKGLLKGELEGLTKLKEQEA